MVKNPPTDAGDEGSIPGSGRSPAGGNGNSIQYFCLENPMERGALFMGSQSMCMLSHVLSMHNSNSHNLTLATVGFGCSWASGFFKFPGGSLCSPS